MSAPGSDPAAAMEFLPPTSDRAPVLREETYAQAIGEGRISNLTIGEVSVSADADAESSV